MKADAKTEAAVMSTINEFLKAYAKKDLNGVLQQLVPDPDAIFIGTGVDEKRIGLAEIKTQLKRDFAQSEELSMEWDWHSVSAAGPVAWMAGDLIMHAKVDGKKLALKMRWTGVLEKRGGKWLLVQLHNSLPAAAQAAGQSFPTS